MLTVVMRRDTMVPTVMFVVRVICGVLGLLLVALVPRTVRGEAWFSPHASAGPGKASAGIFIQLGWMPWQKPGGPGPRGQRWTGGALETALAGLLLATAVSGWVFHTLDRWLLQGLAIVLLLSASTLLVRNGAASLCLGIHARRHGATLEPRISHEDQEEEKTATGDDPMEVRGHAVLARLMPLWAKGLSAVIIGLLVFAILVGTAVHRGWTEAPRLLLDLMQALVYVAAAMYAVFRLEARRLIAYGLVLVILNRVGVILEPIELWRHLTKYLGL